MLPKEMFLDIEKDSVSKEEKQTLADLGFLVDAEEEMREILGFIDELNSLKKTFGAIVAMNLDCNLACRYCFEGTRKGKFYMSKETADQAIEFVKNKITQSNNSRFIDELYVTFYGGEPLLSRELINYIAERLKTLAKDKGIKFAFSFMTNGTLLTGKSAKELKRLGLREAYITIDGPKDLHDASRPFKGGGSSFEAIIRNLKEVCGVIDVFAGGNFAHSNYRRFPELLDYMITNGLTPEKLKTMQFYPVVDESHDVALPDFHDGLATFNDPWIFEASLFLREEILKRGYRVDRVSTGGCMLEFGTDLIVNYDGAICRCPGLIGRDGFKDGDIFGGMKDVSSSQSSWKNDECLDCAYLPLCFGGCRYMKFVRDGNMEGVDCKKPYFDAMLEALVKQDLRYGLTA